MKEPIVPTSISPEYKTWSRMKDRCSNKNSISFKNYGGRGIGVCERWASSFKSFYEDMGKRPTQKHSIDRIDCYGWYGPENCRWATPKEQSNNKTNSRMIEYLGQSMTLTLWANKIGMEVHTLLWRLDQGWSLDRAFNEPVVETRHRGKLGPNSRTKYKDINYEYAY